MKYLAFGALLCALIAFVVPAMDTQKSYKVHSEGVVVITGASSGIGLSAALGLDKLGYKVFAGVRNEKAAVELKKRSPTIIPLMVDVSIDESCVSSAETVSNYLKSTGLPFVALVNNAGISWRLPLELESLDRIKEMYNVNVFGLTRMTQLFLPFLRKSGGRIINIGSVAAHLWQPAGSSYGGTKRAVQAITDSLRVELAEFKISVSTIEPAYIKTAIAQKQVGENAPWKRVSNDRKPYVGLYQDYMEKQDKKRAKADDLADTTEVTTRDIVDAIRNPYPKPRYIQGNVLGTPAWIMVKLGQILPSRVVDALILSI